MLFKVEFCSLESTFQSQCCARVGGYVRVGLERVNFLSLIGDRVKDWVLLRSRGKGRWGPWGLSLSSRFGPVSKEHGMLQTALLSGRPHRSYAVNRSARESFISNSSFDHFCPILLRLARAWGCSVPRTDLQGEGGPDPARQR